jgi:hypothetical protein
MLLASGAGLWGQSRKASDHRAKDHANPALAPSPEMKKLLQAFTGDWNVSENFEVSATKQGRMRQGHATFTTGPGFSLVEEYRSNGSAGELRFLGVLWWDPKSNAYQFFTCANSEGCSVRGTARWEGNNLVNTWEEETNGKRVRFKDSFTDISQGSFTLISEGASDGTPVWRVITKYDRSETRK